MKKSFCLLGLVLCVGCTTAIVRPYVGEQQNWPIASGSIVNTRYSLPIFTSLPSAAYDIIAEMRIESPLYKLPEEGHMSKLAKKAKGLGADALMFVQGQVFFAANYGLRSGEEIEGGGKPPSLTQVNRFNPDSFKAGVTIIAIKWLGEPPVGLRPKQEMPVETPQVPAEEVSPAMPEPETPAAPPAPEPEVVPAPEPAPEVPSEPPAAEQPAPPVEEAPAAPSAPEPPPAPEVPQAEEPAPPPPIEPAPAD